jgi:hypothetical protein
VRFLEIEVNESLNQVLHVLYSGEGFVILWNDLYKIVALSFFVGIIVGVLIGWIRWKK